MNSMEIREVMRHLPHRYPFLLIDRVLDYTVGKSLVGLKNITFNEPIFTGHFPIAPIFPGVLILESLAQATGILAFKTCDRLPDDKSLYYFAGVDNARFRKPVIPGDQLILKIDLIVQRRSLWKFKTIAEVDGNVVTSADMMCIESSI